MNTDYLTSQLEAMGVTIRSRNFIGDSSYPTEHTLTVGNIHALGPTFDMALCDFVKKLLEQRNKNKPRDIVMALFYLVRSAQNTHEGVVDVAHILKERFNISPDEIKLVERMLREE